jgi:hypothetical protein
MKKCENCGVEHDGTYGSGRFCSNKCKQDFCIIKGKRNFRLKTKCEICKKEIKNGVLKKHILKHQKEKEILNTLFKCEYCNKEFCGKINNANRFCCNKCARAFSTKEKRSLINEKVKKKLTKKIEITKKCPICHNEYKTFKTQQICCSMSCAITKNNRLPKNKKIHSENAKKNFKGNRNSYAYGWYNSNIAGRVYLESSYELKVAQELDKNNINWIRPQQLYWINEQNVKKRYFPDFYLKDYDIYLDPKNNYLIETDKNKIKRVIEQNNIKLLVLDKNTLKWDDIKKLII